MQLEQIDREIKGVFYERKVLEASLWRNVWRKNN